VKLGTGFKTEKYDFPNASDACYFPILYKDKFIACIAVDVNGDTGDYFMTYPDLTFVEALNTLASSCEAPIMFAYGRDGAYARDSEGKITLVKARIPSDPKAIEEQLKGIRYNLLPKNIVATGQNQVFPEKMPGQLTLIDDGLPELIVKDYKNGWMYISRDGGKTWQNNAKPPMFVSIPATSFPQKDGQIPYAVHNNTKEGMWFGQYYTLQKWDGQKWLKYPEFDEMAFNDIAMLAEPGKAGNLTARWKNVVDVPAGRYKLVKMLNANGLELICEAVFTLV
jgi:hypothetical protein